MYTTADKTGQVLYQIMHVLLGLRLHQVGNINSFFNAVHINLGSSARKNHFFPSCVSCFAFLQASKYLIIFQVFQLESGILERVRLLSAMSMLCSSLLKLFIFINTEFAICRAL